MREVIIITFRKEEEASSLEMGMEGASSSAIAIILGSSFLFTVL